MIRTICLKLFGSFCSFGKFGEDEAVEGGRGLGQEAGLRVYRAIRLRNIPLTMASIFTTSDSQQCESLVCLQVK